MRKSLLAAVATVAFAFTVAACQPQQPAVEEPVAEAPVEAPAQPDIVATAQAAGTFNTLAELLTTAELVDDLQGAGPFTVFAPTDEAFAKVDAKTVEALKADKVALARVLSHHVVAGETLSTAIADGKSEVTTLAGTTLAIEKTAEGVTVGGAKVTQADIDASNGVIHVIDTVIVPPAAK